MTDIDGLMHRWRTAGILDADAVDRIRAFESEQKKPAGLHWQGLAALILGAILLGCGIVLFVSAHWDDIGPAARFALVLAMVSVCHIAGSMVRAKFRGLSTTLHAVGTVATGAAIALVGQIFNIEDHWPAAILLWALAALAGWILLQDEAQQTLTLLLFPAWILSELGFYAEGNIGQSAFIGRFLFVWAVLYLTFSLASRRKAMQGVLFAAAAVASVLGVALMAQGWHSWAATETFLSFGTQVWGWTAIAGLPLAIAAFKGHKGLIPPAAAVAVAALLPWCQRSRNYHYPGVVAAYTVYGPNFAAHALVSAFAVFLIVWGVRVASRALVNFAIVGFGISVAWFYFSDVFDKVGRSLGLIGLGILFLAGAWVLEKARRRLLAHMDSKAEVAL